MDKKVKPPAIALIVLGALAVLASIYGFLSPADPEKIREAMQQGSMSAEMVDWVVEWAGKIGILWNAVGLSLGVIVILGGVRMLKLQSWGLAFAGSIVAMIPCTCCCVLGIPVGIWAIIVLLDKDVKAAFGVPVEPPPL